MTVTEHPQYVGRGYAIAVRKATDELQQNLRYRYVTKRLIINGEATDLHQKPIGSKEDQSPAAEAIQITEDLNDKLTILKAKTDASTHKQVMHRLIYHGLEQGLHKKPI